MNEYLSNKLRVISLVSMVMVVFLHSYNATVKFTSGSMNMSGDYNFFIQNFFSQGITRIAVPIFFCISGYLFFLNTNGTWNEFTFKLKRRTRSLLAPYLLWSVWGILFYLILQLLPSARIFFTNDLVSNYSLSKILDKVFLNPIPYQLWFLRDLMVLVACSPLIYWMTRYLKSLPILVLFILWLDLFDFNFIIFTHESVLFYCLGAYFAIDKPTVIVQKTSSKYYWVFSFIWLLFVSIKTLVMLRNPNQITLILSFHKIGILFGIIAFWTAYDLLMIEKAHPNKTLLKLSSLSFFIYAFHEPVLTIIKKGLFFFTGTREAISIVNYLLAPLITIMISIIIGTFLKKYLRKFYALITGGR